ncbi:MAG: hypothetical protein ACP6IY_09410 [Promethearchaeia archaeon]
MALEKNKKYVLVFNIFDKILTYTGDIVDENDDGFIVFIDKYNKKISYKKDLLLSYSEVEL